MAPQDTILTSMSNPVIRQMRGLEQKKNRDSDGLFLVSGLRYCSEALLAGWSPVCVLATPQLRQDAALRRLLAAHKVQRHEVAPELMQRLTGRDNAEDVVISFRQKYADAVAMNDGLWLALEEVRDPGNLGTMIRTAEAAGASGVLMIGNCCDVWSPEVIRATAGAFARVPLVRMERAAFVKWAKAYKGAVTGTEMQAPQDYRKARYQAPGLILLGSEHAGLSKDVAACSTATVKIPMKGQIESLNVATAAALLLFEATRQAD